MACGGEYFDLDQLPDQTPTDLYKGMGKESNLKMNLPLSGTQKLSKPLESSLPPKLF